MTDEMRKALCELLCYTVMTLDNNVRLLRDPHIGLEKKLVMDDMQREAGL